MGNSRVDRDQDFMKNEYGTEALITDYGNVYDRWAGKKERKKKRKKASKQERKKKI